VIEGGQFSGMAAVKEKQAVSYRVLKRCVVVLGAMAGVSAGLLPGAARADGPVPALPQIPAKTFSITEFGAVSDGKTLATEAVKKAIAAATAAGGGTVRVPAGRYLTSPFALASHIDLHVEAGATLLLVNDLEHYPRTEKTYTDWITAEGCTDIAITGEGTIDGQGKPWWDKYRKVNGVAPTGLLHRPQMIRLSRCSRVLIKDVSLTDSPNFHLIPGACRDVTIEHVRITAPADAPNTDAIDPSGWNFRIARCTISVGDDNIAIKPSALVEPGKPSCENFLVEDCTFGRGHGMSIGGQTPGGLRGLIVRNCTFEGTDAGIRMKASRGQGGLVEDCRYEHLTMKNVKVPIYITSYYPSIPKDVETDAAQAVGATTPIWRNIHIEDVTITDSPEAGRIIGLPEMPIENLTFKNVKITTAKGLRVVRAKGVEFIDSTLRVQSGPPLILHEAQVKGLEK
jgi:polygalacturonase